MNLRSFLKGDGKKNKLNLLIIFLFGILILISTSNLFENKNINTIEKINEINFETNKNIVENSYEEIIENRLEEILSLVENVGKIKVMIKVQNSKEIIIAEDTTSNVSTSTEIDSQGGSRQSNNNSIESKKIILGDSSGKNSPLVVKELEPTIEGVLIISEGGSNINVKDSLIRATQSLLGISINKIQVLKMK